MSIATDEAPRWQQLGACGPEIADAFFVERAGRFLSRANLAAIEICNGCPVRRPCYDAAAATPRGHFTYIAGGTVWKAWPKQRRPVSR